MTWLCPRPCGNKTADGYCGTSWCINPMYSNIGTANEKLMGGLRKTTHADHIRSMTDEELANFVSLCCGWTCAECPVSKECDGDKCFGTWLDWLKQEVEE